MRRSTLALALILVFVVFGCLSATPGGVREGWQQGHHKCPAGMIACAAGNGAPCETGVCPANSLWCASAKDCGGGTCEQIGASICASMANCGKGFSAGPLPPAKGACKSDDGSAVFCAAGQGPQNVPTTNNGCAPTCKV